MPVVSMFRRFRLFVQTVHFLSWHQILNRLTRIARRQCDGMFCRPTLASRHPEVRQLYIVWVGLAESNLVEETESLIRHADDLAKRKFRFLGETGSFADSINWNDPCFSQLWRYHLHYFHYFRDLAAFSQMGEGIKASRLFCRYVDDWVAGNDSLNGDGWHPYTLSLRLVNWVQGYRMFSESMELDERFCDRMLRSMYRQADLAGSTAPATWVRL